MISLSGYRYRVAGWLERMMIMPEATLGGLWRPRVVTMASGSLASIISVRAFALSTAVRLAGATLLAGAMGGVDGFVSEESSATMLALAPITKADTKKIER